MASKTVLLCCMRHVKDVQLSSLCSLDSRQKLRTQISGESEFARTNQIELNDAKRIDDHNNISDTHYRSHRRRRNVDTGRNTNTSRLVNGCS